MIDKLLVFLINMYANHVFNKIEKSEYSDREIIQMLITPLKLLKKYSKVTYAYYLPIEVYTPIDNLNELIDYFNQIYDTVEKGKAFPISNVKNENKLSTLTSLLVDKKGAIVSTLKIDNFIVVIKNLCPLLEKAEKAEYGIEEHNTRVLANSIASLKTIVIALLINYQQ